MKIRLFGPFWPKSGLFRQKEDQFRSIFSKRSAIRPRSDKADLLGSTAYIRFVFFVNFGLQEALECLLLALPGHLFRSEASLLGQVLSDHRHKFSTGLDSKLHCWLSTQHYTLHYHQQLSIEHLAIHCTAGLELNISQPLSALNSKVVRIK